MKVLKIGIENNLVDMLMKPLPIIFATTEFYSLEGEECLLHIKFKPSDCNVT